MILTATNYSIRYIIVMFFIITPVSATGYDTFLNNRYSLNLSINSQSELKFSISNPGSIFFDSIQFDILNRKFTPYFGQASFLQSANTQSQNIYVSNWNQEHLPLLNQRPLDLKGKSLRLSISENDDYFAISSSEETVLYTAAGKRIWTQREVHPIISLLISSNNRYVITRNNQGVIRWQDFQSGKILFSLFLTKETGDWIIWSPSGYYDSSRPFYNPLTIQLYSLKSISLAQLHRKFFNPEIINLIITGQTASSNKTGYITSIDFPEISIDGRVFDQINTCIKSNQEKKLLSHFKVNNVTISQSTPITNKINPECTFEDKLNLKPYQNIKNLTVAVSDEAQDVLSRPVKLDLNLNQTSSVKKNTVIYKSFLKHQDKQWIKPKSLAKDTLKQLPVDRLKSTSLSDQINKDKASAFLLLLTADCSIFSDQLIFLKNKEKLFTLENLSKTLANTHTTRSLLLINCHGGNNIKSSDIKKNIFNFIAETGRSMFFIWSPDNRGKKEFSTLLRQAQLAFRGDADLNDSLTISSDELIQYLKTAINEASFAESGKNALFFSHTNPLTNFDLPVIITD